MANTDNTTDAIDDADGNVPSTHDLVAEVLEASYRMKAGGDLVLHLLVDGSPQGGSILSDAPSRSNSIHSVTADEVRWIIGPRAT
jgi:hypothetical protein